MIYKILLWYHQRKIKKEYDKKLSGIIDCLQYIIDIKKGVKQ